MNTTPHTTRRSALAARQLQRLAKLSVAAIALSLLTACGAILYKAEIAQGNFVSKEQVDTLKLGMPRLQVADILGTPLLVSVFHADRWEYVFNLKRQGIDTPSYKLTVFFKGDELERIDGSNMPTEQEFIDFLAGNKK
jgi:outer membrane protein assembly factor BamE